MRGCASSIHNAIDRSEEGLVAAFELVLVLVVRLRLPETDPQQPKVIKNTVASLVFARITEQTKRSTPCANKILKAGEEIFGGVHGFDMDDVGKPTKENLGHFGTTIDGRGVTINSIREHIVIEWTYIHGRLRGFVAFEEIAIGAMW